ILNFRRNLSEILVGEREGEAVLTRFGEHAKQSFRAEILKLIQINTDDFPFRGGGVRSAKERALDHGNKNHSQKAAGIFSQFSFRQIDEHDLFVRESAIELKFSTGLAENVSEQGSGEQWADFIENRCDVFLAGSFTRSRVWRQRDRFVRI